MKKNKVIEAAMAAQYPGIAIHHVAEALGITAPTMHKALSDFESLNLRSAKAIAEGLGLSIDGILVGEKTAGGLPCACPACGNAEGVAIRGAMDPANIEWILHCPACNRISSFESKPYEDESEVAA